MGNLASIQNMLKKVGVLSCMISEAEGIGATESLITPDMGKFDYAMRQIESVGDND